MGRGAVAAQPARGILNRSVALTATRDGPDELARADITHKPTRPRRPQTSGKAERFNRTLLDEWACARPYRSEQERRDAFPGGCTPTSTTADTPR
ncbi:hypothetical protein GCM10018777_64240 [Streptomyces albogriseolus]|uniref:integrase core domain-containing protein n=1 Tax=Streptomyces albogriseolus TaxID=1887 RepID=UPI0019CE74F9|nr:hypothetical protein GCM10018777_64240 [Streptomyces viridodiastaticus]